MSGGKNVFIPRQPKLASWHFCEGIEVWIIFNPCGLRHRRDSVGWKARPSSERCVLTCGCLKGVSWHQQRFHFQLKPAPNERRDKVSYDWDAWLKKMMTHCWEGTFAGCRISTHQGSYLHRTTAIRSFSWLMGANNSEFFMIDGGLKHLQFIHNDNDPHCCSRRWSFGEFWKCLSGNRGGVAFTENDGRDPWTPQSIEPSGSCAVVGGVPRFFGKRMLVTDMLKKYGIFCVVAKTTVFCLWFAKDSQKSLWFAKDCETNLSHLGIWAARAFWCSMWSLCHPCRSGNIQKGVGCKPGFRPQQASNCGDPCRKVFIWALNQK